VEEVLHTIASRYSTSVNYRSIPCVTVLGILRSSERATDVKMLSDEVGGGERCDGNVLNNPLLIYKANTIGNLRWGEFKLRLGRKFLMT
jgi:hypothetical protein